VGGLAPDRLTSVLSPTMSKKTNKRKNNARRKPANHGSKPNAGR
jgi:hypothetical protein